METGMGLYLCNTKEKSLEARKPLWWGYLHVNGTLQVKRFFHINDILEAQESPFVERANGPYPAADREEAIKNLQILLEGAHI